MSVKAPAVLEKLVSQEPQLGPEPPAILDWKEYDDHFVAVLEDGRKLTYRKLDPEKPTAEMTVADIKDRVGKDAPRPELKKHKDN